MTIALLSLGSNLCPQQHLSAALAALRQRFGPIVVSPTYRTAAVGFDGPPFLNNAVSLCTEWELEALNAWLHALEDAHGRDRSGPRFSGRTLDIDVVFYGDRIIEGPGHLRIPRPELCHAFVLKPLADIAADFVDPLSGRSLGALWQAHVQFGEAFEVVALGESGPGTGGIVAGDLLTPHRRFTKSTRPAVCRSACGACHVLFLAVF
ncbi:2-amino-4-hydroxy-6-hydroxymethyldihydropteridine diphosphokinase [Xanthomonas translucens pv. graminis]|jgi:2-amino-4-hydroxy-6-hydroxymethyldihydropteridine diphosphokinase|uniref:2-amino-4-hydroxy-6-hydroxymethyldihydropteridine pyrophosphokinase n=2 Tax=Xanthomonas translucens group TaxID=3390202 RepID=A0A1M4IQZ0_9XANT|nr:2-amino-4-hydroxy-6-hydroxymethyldihydropteridine diphosphokinase [Xanthomonas translucens]EKU24212.1 2-amino-4-hydroxy-6- hydroxymethyldihydropteridine diphosphokinase [Xanthomonas translucens pv. graminis ART-Xtg29]UKE55042.1 2-amino-4-hydroxy-6-hydroxymethyldihydropteridine diphosphokinase [Xanthomonas translucens pv. graminis]WIH08292.1 2-amino-4-hydroxy-6-hydroxymethyldihydropteridine diphosphokinase [Xanthomonas translucens pv. graminis]WIH12765.1 2-amino-4-hydroxy-6-hydroxymethyldihyd